MGKTVSRVVCGSRKKRKRTFIGSRKDPKVKKSGKFSAKNDESIDYVASGGSVTRVVVNNINLR